MCSTLKQSLLYHFIHSLHIQFHPYSSRISMFSTISLLIMHFIQFNLFLVTSTNCYFLLSYSGLLQILLSSLYIVAMAHVFATDLQIEKQITVINVSITTWRQSIHQPVVSEARNKKHETKERRKTNKRNSSNTINYDSFECIKCKQEAEEARGWKGGCNKLSWLSFSVCFHLVPPCVVQL